MKKGDTVWLVERDWRGRDREGRPATIASIGRRWITLADYNGGKFDVDTLRLHDSFYAQIYATKEEHDLEVEHGALMDKCRGVFAYNTRRGELSLDQLRRIAAILKEGEA